MSDCRQFFSLHDDKEHYAVRDELRRYARDPDHLVLNKDSPHWATLLDKMMHMSVFRSKRAVWLDREASKLGQEVHRQAKFYLSECLQKAVKNKNITNRLISTVNEIAGVGQPQLNAVVEEADGEEAKEDPKVVNIIVIDPDTAEKTVGTAFSDDYDLEHPSNSSAIIELRLHTLLELYNSLLPHMPEGRLPRMTYGVITPLPEVITAPPAPRNVIQLSDDSAISGWLKASRYHPIVGFTILYRRNDGRPNTPTRRTLPHYSHGKLTLENAVNIPHDSDSDDDRCKTRYVALL